MNTAAFRIEDCQFTVDEAAAHLKISRVSLYKLIRQKKIKTAKLLSRTIIPGRELKRVMDAVAAQAA